MVENDRKGNKIDLGANLPAVRHPQSLFMAQEKLAQQVLRPGQRLTKCDLSALDTTEIIMIGNSKIKPEHLKLRGRDFRDEGGTKFPGKSAVIDFMGIARVEVVNKNVREMLCQRIFGKCGDRRDCVYHTSLGNIEACNFAIYYAPVKSNLLHVRLVYLPHTKPEYKGAYDDVSEFHLKRLANCWRKKRIVD
jgi:hypothetical protein